MTATPEETLEAAVAAADGLWEGQMDGLCDMHETGTREHRYECLRPAVRQAVEAYGRACRLEELRDTAECTCVWRDMEKTILHRQCDRCDRIAELEAEG